MGRGLLHNHGSSSTHLNDEPSSNTQYKELPKSATNNSLASTARSRRETREQYYHNLSQSYKRKAKAVVVTGITLILAGIACTVWHFVELSEDQTIEKHKNNLNSLMAPPYIKISTISGPIFFSFGLLITVCGVTWIPIYKDKIRNIMKDDDIT